MENAINQQPKTTELLVFYFEEGDYARMGTNHAYALGIDNTNQVWSTSGPCYGYIEDPDGFSKSNTPFKKSHLDMNSHIIQSLLNGKIPKDWNRGEECYAGAGNHGICFGKMTVPLVYHHN